MKTQDMLILGGVGLALFLVFKRRAVAAQQPIAGSNLMGATGGSPQPGPVYATPTAVAGVVAGAVNGILNWVSGTPGDSAPSSQPIVSGGNYNPVDSMADLLPSWESLGNWTGWGAGGDDSGNPQDGALNMPSLANFWTSPFGSLD